MLSKCEVCAYAPVSDIDRGRQFYQGVLGLTPVGGIDGGVMFQCARGTRFFMYVSDGAGASKASTLFWSVDDIDAQVADLKRRGVRFERYNVPGMKMVGDIAEDGTNRAAWFRDPDGNILALIEDVRPS